MSAAISELRFLLVDDEPFVRSLSDRVLASLGARTVAAVEDGAGAIEALARAQEPYDILICDLNMPGMDGVELMRHVAGREFGGAVIFLSGEDERLLQAAVDLARAHRLQILGALVKPLRPDLLKEMLGRYQPGPQPAPRPYAAQEPISVDELRAGLAGDACELVFQPKVAVDGGAVIGAEVLARWRDPRRGVLGPGAFIPVAESSGLAAALTRVVFGRAMAQVRDWRASGLELKVAVNVPADCLSDLAFADDLIRMASTCMVDPATVTIEVTETQIIGDIVAPLEQLMRLRMKRMGLSIDDFGTGYSSMEQLKRLPFTELKIDRAFVAGAGENPATRAILESSVGLARRLGLSVVAEGVETQSDWRTCAAAGCDVAQGYFIARPLSPPDFERFHATWAGVSMA